MFGNSSLANFVSPVPICQSEAAFGNILKIFHSTKCRLLAIPLSRGDWGIIYAEDLLSFMSQTWLKPKLAVVNHPQSVCERSDISYISVRDFDSLIKPAIVYQADTKLQEFLNHSHNTSCDRQTEYLIVNALGKLQGRLDRNRILKYLSAETKSDSADAKETEFLNNLSSLIDAIAVPLKIESAAETFHCNTSWQELISGEVCSNNANTMSNSDRQRGANNILPLPRLNSLVKHPNSSISDADLNSGSQLPSLVDRERIKSERGVEWNYLKLPLKPNFQEAKNIQSGYWLVIATKLSSEPTDLAISKWESVGNLLASLTHQLKSPLTGIVGLSSLLGEIQLGTLNQRQARYANLIHSSSQNMIGIVNDVLKLVSLTTEKRSPELVSWESLCRQVYQQVIAEIRSLKTRPDSMPQANELELTIEPGSEIAIADREIISRILFHLMLETHETVKSSAQLKLKIGSSQGLTIIEVSQNTEVGEAALNISSETDSGLNLAIARYLAATIDSSIERRSDQRSPAGTFVLRRCTGDSIRCQFTLLLAKAVTDDIPATDSLAIASPNQKARQTLTILCLYPEPEAMDLEIERDEFHLNLKSCLNHNTQQLVRHRIIEADSLEQADTLARIWQLDVVILDGYQIAQPETYLRSLRKSQHLSNLPLITLDAKTTEAANQQEGLNIYPCLLPAEHRSVEDLLQVIEIATES